MYKIIINFLLLILPTGIFAQSEIEKILSEIESNNTTLQAYKNLNEAQKLENKTGIYLTNPEVGINYLWGDPSAIGNRKDLSVTQSFDFPTSYGIKKQIADVNNKQSDLEYELNRKSILFQSKTICIELVYLNAQKAELQKRLEHAISISQAFNTKFEKGETNIIETNKAQLNLLNAQKKLEANKTEYNFLLAELRGLNGGKEMNLTQRIFNQVKLPSNFETWFAENENNNPLFQQSSNQITIQEKQIKLTKALNLPKFSTGYMSESVVGESFKGISAGISIPLWENKNAVKLATAQQKVAEEKARDVRIQTYTQLKSQFEKAKRLQITIDDYKKVLESVNSSKLLKKALDAGELSLIEYMLELSLYYETVDKILSIEKELQLAVIRLYYFNL